MTHEDAVKLLGELRAEMKAAGDEVQKADKARNDTIAEIKLEIGKGSKSVTDVEAKLTRIVEDEAKTATRLQGLEDAMNQIMKRLGRPGSDPEDVDKAKLRKQAVGLLEYKHYDKFNKQQHVFEQPFKPTDEQIAEAEVAVKGMRALMHTTNIDSLPSEYRKALSAFTFGSQGFILAPELSNEILSCLIDINDIAGLMRNITISGPSIKFMVDNEVWDVAAWACESSCFANNPTQQIGSGLGELEIKPESLRYIVCATRDLLDDASVNIEQWMIQKVNRAFRHQIANAILTGDGFGKPMGILNPNSGIPVCETAPGTPPGMFTWQDLVMLRWQVPQSMNQTGSYLMNQNSFGLALTLSDANGRPVMIPIPLATAGGNYPNPGAVQWSLMGTPVNLAQMMPDVAPGATPIAYGNWQLVYMVVNRKAVTMQQDPYSAGFCILYKFESRIGGGVLCPNAARLMRVR
jgi:HK97 family phage major capsid protein